MATRQTHMMVGVPVGAAVAAYAGRDQLGPNLLVEIVGGGLGGALGALLPDRLEPPTSSWHRSIAHSYTTAAAGIKVVPRALSSWQRECRARARKHDWLKEQTVDPWVRLWHAACALFWRILSGFAVGLAAGYASHLALDFLTPRGLPLAL